MQAEIYFKSFRSDKIVRWRTHIQEKIREYLINQFNDLKWFNNLIEVIK